MGHAYQSPLRRHEVLAGLVKQMNARTFVEVGCKEGRTCGYLLKEFPELHVTAIDPWAAIANADEDYRGWDFEAIEREFWENVGEHKDRCTHLRTLSLDAVARVTGLVSALWAGTERSLAPSGGYDIVFIDAAHDYDNCLADINAWWPLVRAGGYLTGHDYQHKFPGVMRAVAAAFPLLRVAICPDSVWVVQKLPDLRVREAA